MSKTLERVQELLDKHRDFELTEAEVAELGELHLQALYAEAQKIDDNDRANRAMQLAWSTVTKAERIKSPVERMNQAGAIMLESVKQLQAYSHALAERTAEVQETLKEIELTDLDQNDRPQS